MGIRAAVLGLIIVAAALEGIAAYILDPAPNAAEENVISSLTQDTVLVRPLVCCPITTVLHNASMVT